MSSERISKIVGEKEFDAVINGAATPVVMDFFATWCSPCKAIAPILDQIADELAEGVRICKVDVDENPALTQNLGVRSIPTLFFYHNGKMVEKIGGQRSKAEYLAAIERARSAPTDA
jgi:thioredoxin 1